MYKLVIFDLDGTLLNTIGDLAAAGNHTLEVMGFPQHPEESYRHFVGNGIPKLIERMLPAGHDKETEQKAYDIFMEYYSAHKCDRTKPYPGIPELIRKLRAAGIKCAANSNKAHEFTQELIKLSFGDEFDDVIGFGAGFPAKPDPGARMSLSAVREFSPQRRCTSATATLISRPVTTPA